MEFYGRVALREVFVLLCGASMCTSTDSMALTNRLNILGGLESGHSYSASGRAVST